MKIEMKKSLWHESIIMVSSLFLAVSFYVVCGINSDDAGTYVVLREQFELGGSKFDLRGYLNPWYLVALILYKLEVGKTGTELLAWCYSVWIFLCSYMTLKIALLKCIQEQKNSWLLFLTVFIMMPAVDNRYHLPVIFAGLLLLWATEKFISEHKKIPAIFVSGYVIYTLLFTADKMLLLMQIAAPSGLYALIWCLQKKDRHKYLLSGLFGVTFILVCIKVIADLCSYPLTTPWGGYGGSEYMYWTDMGTFFDKNIPSFFAALLINYNIDINGGLIQFLSFYWLIKLMIVGVMLCVFVRRCRDIVVKGIENVDIVDALSVLASVALVGVNILNGIAKAYSVENQPINRYAGLAWYLLIIIFIRWVNERYVSYDVMKLKHKNVSSGVMMGMILVFLIAGYSKPIYRGRQALVAESCQAQLNFLEGYGDEYQYGLASYWKSHPITALSNGKYTVCGGWITIDEVDHDKIYLEAKSNLSEYKDGGNYFNFIISYRDNSMTMGEENIEAVRGDYRNKIVIGDAIYYLYDYDIRWNPRLVMEAVGTDYELTEPIQYFFDFPVGINRIEMQVSSSENFELSIDENEDVEKADVQIIDGNTIYVDLVCTQNTKVTFNVARKTDELTTIHKIQLKRIKAAIDVISDEIFLKPGSYIVTFNGSDLHDAQAVFEGDNIVVQKLANGRIKNRYQIDIDTAQIIKYTITGKNAVVNRCYYENTILLESDT